MRKTAATILGLVWIGYIVWPLYDLSVLLVSNPKSDPNLPSGFAFATVV